MNGLGRYLPFGVAAAAVVYFLWAMQPPTDPPDGFHLHDFAMIPVMDGGRPKPADSMARNDLTIISGRQTYRDEKGDEQPAVRWLLDALSYKWSKDGSAEKDKVFRIDNDQVLKVLDLAARPGSYRYALEEFAPHLGDSDYDLPQGWVQLPTPEDGMVRPLANYGVLDADGKLTKAKASVSMFPGDGGGVLQNVNRWRGQLGLTPIKEDGLPDAALNVGGTASPYVDLEGTTKDGSTRLLGVIVPNGGATWFFKFTGSPDLIAQEKAHFDAFVTSHQPAFEKSRIVVQHIAEAKSHDEKDRDLFDVKMLELGDHLITYRSLRDWDVRLVPPDAPGGNWKSLDKEYADYLDRLDAKDPTAKVQPMLMLIRYWAAAQKDPTREKEFAAAFNQTVDAYRAELATSMPAVTQRAAFETGFNDFAPFYQCAILYVIVFVLTCLSWVAFTKPLNWSAFALAVVTLVVHTGALISRMYLMDRPLVFVTNLYSTAVFIGWVCVIAGLVFEAIYRNGIGNFVGSVAGFCTMVVAHFLSIGGDTLENLRAVLDTNFWLATHVTAVNTGYAATFVAGLLGTLFVVRGVFTRTLDKGLVKTLGDATYGAVCFATLFSFTGTVLGGIWADQSWGRFWGWDPKENGALIIVVWNALILHARWGGMVKQRGLAVLTLVGNIVTAWSWFGVNLLGIGLHAYGFQSGTAWAWPATP